MVCSENTEDKCCGLFSANLPSAKKHFVRYHRPDIASHCIVEGCSQKFFMNVVVVKHLREHADAGEFGETIKHSNDDELQLHYTSNVLKSQLAFDDLFFPSIPSYVRLALENKPVFNSIENFDLDSNVIVPFKPVLKGFNW